MNRIYNLGFVNIDHVYRVANFVRPGETLAASSYSRGAGGKGFNQSIALARAGAAVCHVGATGADADWLRSRLQAEGVDIRCLALSDEATGHAVIQVSDAGENSIVLHGGANLAVSPEAVSKAVAGARAWRVVSVPERNVIGFGGAPDRKSRRASRLLQSGPDVAGGRVLFAGLRRLAHRE